MQEKLIELYKTFAYKWVALSKEQNVLVSGDNIRDVEAELKKKNLKATEIRYIMPIDKAYAPVCR